MIRKLKKLLLSLSIFILPFVGFAQLGAKTDTPGATVKTPGGFNLGNPIDELISFNFIIVEAPGYKKQTVAANDENNNFRKLKKLPSLQPLVTSKELGFTIQPGECKVNIINGNFKFTRYKDDGAYRKSKGVVSIANEYDLDFYSDRLQESLWTFLKTSSLLDTSEAFFRNDASSLVLDMEFNDFDLGTIATSSITYVEVKGDIKVKDAFGTELGVYDFSVKCNPMYASYLAFNDFLGYAFRVVHGEYGMEIWSDAIEDVVFQFTNSDLLKKIVRDRKIAQEAILAQPIVKVQKGKSLGITAESLSTSIVTIKTKDGHGSGCLISADGYVVTNHHVAGTGKDSIEVLLNNGEKYNAKLIRSDFVYDLALLKIESDFPFCSIEPIHTSKSKLGDKVTVIGTPADPSLGQTVTKGIVSGFRNAFGKTMIQTDAHINPGNSGGALFNDSGELIGIVSSKAAGSVVEGVGFAIPAHYIYERLRLEY